MATYKVLQDIEAEDKLLGPLTLKQFIFAIVTLMFGFLTYSLTQANIILGIPFVLPTLLFGYMAAPIHREQPADIWLGARLRFFFKPRIRIWNQDGVHNLVEITAPKKQAETKYTKGFDSKEARSRLRALATTIDSRGWAVKNVNANLYATPEFGSGIQDSDRLVLAASLPQDVPQIDVTATDDVMNATSEVAQHFETMMQQSEMQKNTKLQNVLSDARNPSSVASATTSFSPPTTPQIDEVAAERLLEEAHKKLEAQTDNYHLKTVDPVSQQQPTLQQTTPAQPVAYPGYTPQTPTPLPIQNTKPQPLTDAHNPAILELAKNNEFTVATIAKQAERIEQEFSDNDVVSLR